jgi:hypothetical protein
MGVGVDVLMRDAKLGDNAGGGRQERASRERDHATTRAKRDTGSGAHDALQLGAPRGQSRVSEPAIHSTSTSVSQAHKTVYEHGIYFKAETGSDEPFLWLGQKPNTMNCSM